VDRLLTAVAVVLVVVVMLPTIASATQPLIPSLIAVVVTLALLRAVWPGTRSWAWL